MGIDAADTRSREIMRRSLERLMRDWILLLAPVALIVYFLAYPDQFSVFMSWASRYIG